MLLNIALILYVAVCLYLCLRNKKALYRFQGGGRQFTQSSKSGEHRRKWFLLNLRLLRHWRWGRQWGRWWRMWGRW